MPKNLFRRGQSGRVQAQKDVAQPERYYPKHFGWHSIPRAYSLQKHSADRSRLEVSNRCRQTRFWRSVQGAGLCRQASGQIFTHIHAR